MHRFARLTTIPTDGQPPTEFRIFVRGENPNTNGPPILFDDKAAAALMGAYRAHGVDPMIDLEHLSLDPDAPNYDPDAQIGRAHV